MAKCEWCKLDLPDPCSPRAWRKKDQCPFWKTFEADFYRRIAGGPVTMFLGKNAAKPPPQAAASAPKKPRRAKERATDSRSKEAG